VMIAVSTVVSGGIFVGLAAANVTLMLEASRVSVTSEKRRRLIRLHRVGGYLFVIFFCLMAYVMTQRLMSIGLSGKLPVHLVVHVGLALVLIPLLGIKIAIARRYKNLHSLLLPLGLAIFVASFLLVSFPSLSELLRSATPGRPASKLVAGLIVAVCLWQCLLVWRSTRNQDKGKETLSSIHPSATIQPSQIAHDAMTLLLASIKQETHDTKTLRFLVPKEKPFRAKPGQFLSFQWMVNGHRITRSYTISSSPVHPEYVEITPKRMENGGVSNFLHNEAKPGLTVEASGPHGRFYFDEAIHRSIVLIAAGSGITPMISIIRYISDVGLSNAVTLLYWVRARKDIIFESELQRLKGALSNFRYVVSLSQPEQDWTGPTGRFTAEFAFDQLRDLQSPTFFLCGPKGFMENARQILTPRGVAPANIMQESFGDPPQSEERSRDAGSASATVAFLGSQKICKVPAGNSVLQVAEQNGVAIPFGCRQGLCGTCATRLLSGVVHMDTDAGLTPKQKEAGYVLQCVCHAEGTVILAA